jgi:hypothetical protein
MKRLAAERSARIDVLEARGIHRFDLITIVMSVCFKFCADDDSIGHSPHRHSRSPRSPRSPKSPKSPSSRHLRAEYDILLLLLLLLLLIYYSIRLLLMGKCYCYLLCRSRGKGGSMIRGMPHLIDVTIFKD